MRTVSRRFAGILRGARTRMSKTAAAAMSANTATHHAATASQPTASVSRSCRTRSSTHGDSGKTVRVSASAIPACDPRAARGIGRHASTIAITAASASDGRLIVFVAIGS